MYVLNSMYFESRPFFHKMYNELPKTNIHILKEFVTNELFMMIQVLVLLKIMNILCTDISKLYTLEMYFLQILDSHN